MKPREKWRRLKNPETIEDYGLSLSEAEMRSFPEGRRICEEIDRVRAEDAEFDALNEMMVRQCAETHNRIVLNAIMGGR